MLYTKQCISGYNVVQQHTRNWCYICTSCHMSYGLTVTRQQVRHATLQQLNVVLAPVAPLSALHWAAQCQTLAPAPVAGLKDTCKLLLSVVLLTAENEYANSTDWFQFDNDNMQCCHHAFTGRLHSIRRHARLHCTLCNMTALEISAIHLSSSTC